MLRLFGINPAWGLPCVSPFVTKVAYGLAMKGIPYQLVQQNLSTVATDSPTGKLPYVELNDGSKLVDSSKILTQLTPDTNLAPWQRALSLAVERMLDEHLYWHVAVEPRWHNDTDWVRYRPYLFGVDPFPDELESAAKTVREHILGQWIGCGLGRLSASRRAERAVEDINALEALLEQGQFLLGDLPSNIDAAIAAMTAHALKAPFESAVRDELLGRPRFQVHLDDVLKIARDS